MLFQKFDQRCHGIEAIGIIAQVDIVEVRGLSEGGQRKDRAGRISEKRREMKMSCSPVRSREVCWNRRGARCAQAGG